MWPGTSMTWVSVDFPDSFAFGVPASLSRILIKEWVTIVLWMRNLFAPSCLLDSSDKTQWPFLQTRDTGCVGGSASTSLWSEAVMAHFPRWNDQNEICKEKRYWSGKSWATSAACTSTKVVPMHTIQSKVENVNQCWKSIWRTVKLEIFQKVWGIHQNVCLKCRLVNQCLVISKHFLCKDLGTVIQLIANPFIFIDSLQVPG